MQQKFWPFEYFKDSKVASTYVIFPVEIVLRSCGEFLWDSLRWYIHWEEIDDLSFTFLSDYFIFKDSFVHCNLEYQDRKRKWSANLHANFWLGMQSPSGAGTKSHKTMTQDPSFIWRVSWVKYCSTLCWASGQSPPAGEVERFLGGGGQERTSSVRYAALQERS